MFRRLDKILLEKGLITDRDSEEALQIQSQFGGQLSEILLRIGAVGETDILTAQREQFGFDILDKSDAPTDLEQFVSVMAPMAPLDWWIRQQAVAWRHPATKQLVCVARDPVAPGLEEMFETSNANEEPLRYLAYGKDLDFLLESVRSYNSDDNRLKILQSEGTSRDHSGEEPTVEFINKMVSQAVYTNASDIHIEPGELGFTVRLRVDGVLTEYAVQPLRRFNALISRIKLLSGLDIAERRLPQDGRQTVRAGGKTYDLRVSTLPGVFGESVVMRLLSKQQDTLTMSKLGLLDRDATILRSIASSPNGIFLVTGPTGSGKSTTLHAALHEITDGKRKIITVEDPVEYNAEGITQVQVKADIDLTFANALRSILRQDPDVIMIGEIRDRETAEIAIQSALTGHMVFSTLHTNDGIGAVTRLLNMGVERFLLSSALVGVMAQRLVRRICSHCAQPLPSPAQLEQLKQMTMATNVDLGNEWRKAVGCDLCANTGYKGRVGVYELLPLSSRLREKIDGGANEEALLQAALEEGFAPLLCDGLIKASRGLTTLDELDRVLGLQPNNGSGNMHQ